MYHRNLVSRSFGFELILISVLCVAGFPALARVPVFQNFNSWLRLGGQLRLLQVQCYPRDLGSRGLPGLQGVAWLFHHHPHIIPRAPTSTPRIDSTLTWSTSTRLSSNILVLPPLSTVSTLAILFTRFSSVL